MNEVMTVAVVSVDEAASYRDVVDLLIGRRVSAVPVVDEAVRLTRQVPGVVAVANELRYDFDDQNILGTGIAYGVA